MTMYGAIQKYKQNRKPLGQIAIDNNQDQEEVRCFRKMDYDERQYKIPIIQDRIKKSIYTEMQDIGQTVQIQFQEDIDLQDFIESTKTLRQKIQQKLNKKTKQRKHKQAIEQTTFRPQISKIMGMSNLFSNKSGLNRSKNISHKSNNKTVHTNKTPISQRIKTQNVFQWQPTNQNSPKNKLINMNFYQRQQLVGKNKKKKAEKWKIQQDKKQIQQCTFKPKLTKYKPRT